MKSINQLTTLLLSVAMLFCGQANAGSPSITKITVQGYMKLAGGGAVSETSADLAFVIYKGSVAPGNEIWGISASAVPISSGLFAHSLSGASQGAGAIGTCACTALTGATLNSALLMSGGTGDLIVHVEAISNIEGNKPSFDITLDSVPTAFVAEQANSVTAGSIALTSIADIYKTSTATGGGEKLVVTDNTGKIDAALLNAVDASTQFSGVTPIANGGTNNGSLGVTAGGVLYTNGSKAMNSGAGTSGYYFTSGGAAAPTWSSPAQVLASMGGAAAGTNSDIIGLTNLTTALSLSQGGTGAALTAVNGGVAYSGAGAMALSAAGTAGDVLVSGGAGSPTWVATLGIAQGGTNNTSINVSSGGIVYADGTKLNTSAVAGGAGEFLTAGVGAPVWVTPTAARTAMGAAAVGANSDITSLTNLTTAVSVAQGGTGNGSLSVANGSVVYTDGTKMAGTGAGTSGQVLTSSGAGAPTWSSVNGVPSASKVALFEDFFTGTAGAVGATGSLVAGDAAFASTALSGTGAIQSSTTESGVYRIATVAATLKNASVGFFGPGAAGLPTCTMGFAAGEAWTFEARVKVSATAANALIRVGLVDNTQSTGAFGAAGSYFELAAGATTMTAVNKGAGTTSSATSSITAATFERWTISYDGAGNTTFSKNGTAIAAAYSANAPTGTALCPGIFSINTGASAIRNIDIDYISFTKTVSR